MYKFLVLFFLGILRLSLPQAVARTSGDAPELICSEHEFFFGQATNDKTITREFVISNEGTAPLRISSVRTDCGCVLASPRQNKLEPGESTVLKASFNLKGRSGPQARRITVISNDPLQPRLTLSLIGEAIAPLEINSERIYWGNIYCKAPAERSCEIKFTEAEQSYITGIAVTTNIFTAEVLTVVPRRRYKIIIRTVPPLPIGPLQAKLLLTTDHPRFKTIEIPMQGRITGDLYAIPAEIVINAGDRKPLNRSFLVYSGLKEQFRIMSVEPPQPAIKANIRSMSAANGHRIDLRNIAPTEDLNGKNIIVRTDCASMPVLIVPIRCTAGE